jgi:hypothetical protein
MGMTAEITVPLLHKWRFVSTMIGSMAWTIGLMHGEPRWNEGPPAKAPYYVATRNADLRYVRGALKVGNISPPVDHGHPDSTTATDMGMSLIKKEQCDSLFETYHRIYGKPVDITNGSDNDPIEPWYTHQEWWDDASHNNKITLNT